LEIVDGGEEFELEHELQGFQIVGLQLPLFVAAEQQAQLLSHLQVVQELGLLCNRGALERAQSLSSPEFEGTYVNSLLRVYTNTLDLWQLPMNKIIL
jgi:hypothetical protein